VRNEEVLQSKVGEEYPKTIRRKNAKSINYIMYRNCLLKHVIEGKTEGGM
jgi:hypothetical protein